MGNQREERKAIFEDTRRLYETHENLIKSIQTTKANQQVIAENDEIKCITENIYDTPAKIVVSKNRSLFAAKEYEGSKVCVLNFASATNPGGGVEKGSNAQEESICRCSTLFPCISDNTIRESFHKKHRELLKSEKLTALYNDDCIYTPNVTVFKTDTDNPILMKESEWYNVDVISCAAPNLRLKPSNEMNPDSGSKVTIKPSKLLELHIKRMRRILDIAKANKEEVMILGAFGCGAFENSPEVVAEAMARVIKEYRYDFKTIEFAVYCSPKDTKNYDIFKRRLG